MKPHFKQISKDGILVWDSESYGDYGWLAIDESGELAGAYDDGLLDDESFIEPIPEDEAIALIQAGGNPLTPSVLTQQQHNTMRQVWKHAFYYCNTCGEWLDDNVCSECEGNDLDMNPWTRLWVE